MYSKDGKKTRFRVENGEKEYTVKAEDLYINLPFLLVNEDDIPIELFSYYASQPKIAEGKVIYPENIESSFTNDVYVGFLKNCETCNYQPPPYSNVNMCENDSKSPYNYKSMQYFVNDCDNPCLGGKLYYYNDLNQEVEITITEQGVYYPNAPTPIKHLINNSSLPGCFWDNATLNLGDFDIYASIVDATLECLCQDAEPIVQSTETIWEDDDEINQEWISSCEITYACPYDQSDINVSSIAPGIFKAKSEPKELPLDEYYLIETCTPCLLNADGTFTEFSFYITGHPLSTQNEEENDILNQFPLLDCEINTGPDEFNKNNIKARVNDSSTIDIHPNPFTSEINIKSSKLISNVRIFDVNGITLLDKEFTTTELTLFIGDFSAGIYFVEINNNNTYEKIFKIR